jgi:hypothetical protein
MALGSMARLTQGGQAPQNAVFVDVVTLVGDSSYPTNGSTGLEAKLQALAGGAGRTVLGVIPQKASGYHLEYDRANGKLLVYRIGALDGNAASAQALTEVTNGVDLSAVTFTLLVLSV